MRLIVPAAGHGFRWGYYWPQRKDDQARGWRKHLAEIHGEAIIHRLVRLFQEAGVDDIFIVAPDNGMYETPGAKLFSPQITGANGDADKFINSQELWDTEGRTALIYGDVYITEEVVATIVQDTNEISAYGRLDESPITGKGQGWIGIGFEPEAHAALKFYADLLVFYKQHRVLDRNGSWELVHLLSTNGSFPVDKLATSPRLLVPLDDITMDIDTPDDYEVLRAAVNG